MNSDVQAVDVEVIEEAPAIAPCKKAPVCKRELFLRPPDWRYQAAVSYLADERKHKTPVIPADPYVQYAIRILRAYRNEDARLYMELLWPEATEAILLGTLRKRTAIVAEIEACIMSGMTAEDCKEADFYIKPVVYELYEKLFFDISGVTAIHSWISDFLFEPERHQENTTLLRSRLLAYYSGKQAGSKAAVIGMDVESEHDLIKQIASTERQKAIFKYMVKNTKLDAVTYAGIMEAAVKSMTERDFQEHMKDRDDAGSSSLEDQANNLEKGIRAFSQKELAQVDNTGLDFVNQYTATILHKGEENGK